MLSPVPLAMRRRTLGRAPLHLLRRSHELSRPHKLSHIPNRSRGIATRLQRVPRRHEFGQSSDLTPWLYEVERSVG